MSSEEFKFVTTGMFDYLDKKRDEFQSRHSEPKVSERYEWMLSSEWALNDCALDGVDEALRVQAIENHQNAVALMLSRPEEQPLTPDTVKEVHSMMMVGLDEEAGTFRSGIVAPLTSQHVPTDPERIEPAISQLLAWISADSFAELHPMQQSALVLIRLLDIFPFTQGTARTCRSLANFFVLRSGFPPAIIRVKDAEAYRRAVDAGLAMDTSPLTTLIANAVQRVLDFSLTGSIEPSR